MTSFTPPTLRRHLLVALTALLFAASASAGTLVAGLDYTDSVHRNEVHSGETLDAIILDGANLSGTNFTGTSFVNASFDFTTRATNLAGAILTNTTLSFATFDRANLLNAIVIGATADNTDWSGANLQGAIFTGTNFSNATFDGANLRLADLSGVSLLGADLSNALLLDQATLTGATYNSLTLLPAGFDPNAAGLVFVDEPSHALLLLVGLSGLGIFGRKPKRDAPGSSVAREPR